MGSLIYLFSTRVEFSFAVHKLAKFSANPGKVYFEGLVHLLGYIRDNKTLGLKYYSDLNDAPVTDILRQANIKTNNHFMAFSDSSWQDCPDTVRSTGAYIIYYQGGPIDHGTHVPVPVAQPSAESEYNASCTSGVTDLLRQANIKTKNHLMVFFLILVDIIVQTLEELQEPI